MKPKILLASYGGGHVHAIISLYKELVTRGYHPLVLGLTTASVKLKDEGISYYSYTDFLTDDDSDALELGQKLIAGMTLNKNIPEEESIAYMGICYQELIGINGAEEAQRQYEKFGRQCFLPRKFMNRVLDKISPDLVITTNSPRSEKALILQAREMGIRSYCVVDFYQDDYLEGGLGEGGFADIVFVPFREMKKLLMAEGRESYEIEVCGNPALDYLASLPIRECSSLVRQERRWQSKFVVLWIKSTSPVLQEAEESIEEILLSTCIHDSLLQLVIRPHPNDTRDYSRFAKTDVFVSTVDERLDPELATCDLLVTMNSTVGLQANLLGKPVIQVDLVEYRAKVPFSLLEIGVSVYSLNELIERITDFAGNLSCKKVLPPVYKVGKSSKKIVDRMESDIRKLNKGFLLN